MTALDALAQRLVALEQAQEALSAPQLAYSSIMNGALRAHDDVLGETMQIGLQWDGTYAPTVVNGPTGPAPAGVTVLDGTEAITVFWDGTFTGGAVSPMDFLRVDIHIGATSDFIPSHANRRGSIVSPSGGAQTIGLPYGTYFIKLVMWTLAGKVSAASDPIEGDSWPVVVSSDGFAPASSPAVQVIGGFDIIHARWTPITNADPVTYDVHISTTSGFTPDSDTLVGSTQSSAFTIKQLPGPGPVNPSDPDTRKFDYFTDYYVRLVARDEDGSAAPGVEGFDQVYQLTGVNFSADSVTAHHVAAGTLTGDLFSATVILSSAIKTAETGQRAEMTPLGFFAYKSDGSIMLAIPTDGSDALYDGELVVRGATVLGGMSIQSNQNELTADAVLTLMRGIVAPIATPQISDIYDTVTPSTAGLSAIQKTNNDPTWGLGGPFDLVASEVTCIEWRSALNCWSMFQIRPNGTREWYIDVNGAPVAPFGAYFSDFKDWEVWSATEIIGSSLPAQNGHFLLLRYMPGGQAWRVWAPSGIYDYTRQNTGQPPALGNNGTRMYIAEVINTNELDIRYYEPTSGGGSMPAAITAYTSEMGYSTGISLAAVTYHATGFDMGTTGRYLTAERGNGSNARLIFSQGTNEDSLHPHGTTAGSTSWTTQTTKEAGSFESPTTNRRGCGWDGSNFWTLGADGKMYKHTSDQWDPSVTSSVIWAQMSLRDTDIAGTGTHETAPGGAKSFNHKRRSKLQWVAPDVPDNGGADDPDRVVLYAARGTMPGNAKPANSGMWKQTEALAYATTVYTTLTTSGTNPLTVGTFPASNPAILRNDNDELQIKGDGTIKCKQFFIGSDEVLALAPYWYGYLNASQSVAHNTTSTVTGWQADGSPNSSGITAASGVYTVPRAGRYRVTAQLWWAAQASPAGTRTAQLYNVAGAVTLASHAIPPSAIAATPNTIDKTVRLVAGAQIAIRVLQTQGAAVNLIGTTPDISFLQIEYVGP